MRSNRKPLLAVLLFILSASTTNGQTTAFTYQGKLVDSGNPANANYDFEFRLFDALSGGTQQGATVQRLNVAVANGNFTIELDFGNQFSGPTRFLDMSVRPSGGGTFTPLTPRQQLLSNPYAIKSLNAAAADGLSVVCRNCITSSQIQSVNGSSVSGQIPVASVPSGSASYVQNSTSQQASSNFNISGDGTAGGTLSGNIVRATTQFNIGIDHALSLGSSSSVFVGRLAGASNTTGSGNTFVGESAGRFNTTTGNNSFFGREAGTLNTASNNSFFGAFSGGSNTTGTRNAFFGSSAGDANDVGNDNAFFGYRAGRVNTASFNSFFGSSAGDSTTSGTNNAFFGYNAGTGNLTGAGNSFFGSGAGQVNTADDNSFFGYLAGDLNTSGTKNAFFGTFAGAFNTSGQRNTMIGFSAGSSTFTGSTTGSYNVFVGDYAGSTNTTGSFNTVVGAGANVSTNNLTHSTAIGAEATVDSNYTIVLGTLNDQVSLPGRLDVSQTALFNANTTFDSNVKLNQLSINGITNLCLNASNFIANCSSSLRYKTNVQAFFGGLDIVQRLRPIAFTWKDGGMRDVGFGAEAVEKIEPLLTTRNAKGEIEGVKYAQLTTVLVNAVNEQQTQIETQQRLIEQQQRQINALKKLVCLSNPNAEVCKLQ